MVLFQDRTDVIQSQQALESEREKRESELEQIAAILKLGPCTTLEVMQCLKAVLRVVSLVIMEWKIMIS
jgi:hypothetical protein